jgi:hypothetical protein
MPHVRRTLGSLKASHLLTATGVTLILNYLMPLLFSPLTRPVDYWVSGAAIFATLATLFFIVAAKMKTGHWYAGAVLLQMAFSIILLLAFFMWMGALFNGHTRPVQLRELPIGLVQIALVVCAVLTWVKLKREAP